MFKKAAATFAGGLCLFAAVGLTPNTAKADILLTVDLTTVNSVTINATDGLSSATISGSDAIGVYLEGFYGIAGSSLGTTSTGAGDLTNFLNPSDGSPALFRGGGGSDPGLNIFSWSSDTTVDFTAGVQAFTGSGTWALDAPEYADMIALGNRVGDLYFPADTFDDVLGATLIGQYEVIVTQGEVPAPGALAVLGLGLVGTARRRRRQ